jgi:hypothetical protein
LFCRHKGKEWDAFHGINVHMRVALTKTNDKGGRVHHLCKAVVPTHLRRQIDTPGAPLASTPSDAGCGLNDRFTTSLQRAARPDS